MSVGGCGSGEGSPGLPTGRGLLVPRGPSTPARLAGTPSHHGKPQGRQLTHTVEDYHAQDLMGRLASGEVLLGDGSYIMTLEKRGYATAGSWTPESAAEHPAAVEQVP